ncbi:MAG: polysaccharide deacetylase, partial [Myxococcales bacterium]
MAAPGRGGGLCALSVDLDEIGHYHAIHGLPPPSRGDGPGPVYALAIARLSAWARGLGVPLTWFAVGADLAVPGNAGRLRALAAAGHEVGNHTLDHRYDLVHLPAAEQRRQVAVGREVLAAAARSPVVGFRSPGYTTSDALLATVAASGHTYDSSVFPCAPYLAAKTAVRAWHRLRGRPGASAPADPRMLLCPEDPYMLGRPFWRPGAGPLVEVPILVTPRARLPVIGTTLTLLPPVAVRALVASCLGRPVLNLELHGLDALGVGDGLDALAGHQPDVAVAASAKLARLTSVVEQVREAGYRFVTLGEAAGV